jgi:hypothetical protein
MKTRNTILRNVVVALALLLGAGAAQGQTVMCGSSPCESGDTSATGILGLNVGGTFYDVTFVLADAEEVYGPPPGVYDFTTDDGAIEAINAVAAALNTIPTILRVNESFAYRIPYDFIQIGDIPNVKAREGIYREEQTAWILLPGGNSSGVYTDETMYADFEEVGGSPAPTIDFGADPETIESGGTSTLSWGVTDADSCFGSNHWPGDKDPVSGTQDVMPSQTSRYVLTCEGPGGQSEEEVTVTVPEPGAILSMAAALATLGVVRRRRRKGCA